MREAHRDVDYTAECLLALTGKQDEDMGEDAMVGLQLVAEALLVLVGFRLPDEER